MATPWIADAQPKPTPRLVRQQQDERLSKAKSFLQSDDTVLTVRLQSFHVHNMSS